MTENRGSGRREEIVAVARELLEEHGPDGLSMRRIADRLSMRAPSLYKHLPHKRALESALISSGFEELAAVFDRLQPATRADAMREIGHAYRAFALEHPHLYRLMTERELDRESLAPGVEDAAAELIVQAAGGDGDLARAAWAFAHGMAVLELNHRFPPGADLDAAWERGLQAIIAAAPDPSAPVA